MDRVIKLARALEEALQEGSGKSMKEIRQYLVDPPVVASCVKGGFEIEVAVFAKHGDTAFFVSLEAGQFGVGTMNAYGDIVESNHYSNITLAVRSFVGAITENALAKAAEMRVVFALAMKSGRLIAFPSTDGAEAYCEAAEVEKGAWLFFSEDGSPLEARFRRPANGTYVLLRAMSGLWLQERLAQVRSVEGCDLSTLPDVVELLKINRGKRAARGI